MSSPLAMAAVTAVLKDLLNDGLLNHDLSSIGSFSISALPPDRISTGQNEPNQLNLFLYQVTPNLGWRNVGLPSRDGNGVRLTAAPLALDLHYLLTAYGSQDLHAEILLGYSMQLLHEIPVLSRAQLRTVLGAPSPVNGLVTPLPSIFGTLSAVDLADQIELIKITPAFLTTEELSKMWTAMQARYRPSMAYIASVVLIQAQNQGKSAAPVLKRGANDRGAIAIPAPFPMLANVRPAPSELLPAMRLGDDLLLTGSNLNDSGSVTAVFENTRGQLTREIGPVVADSPSQLTIHIPGIGEDADAMHEWAAGLYKLMLRVSRPNVPDWTTNSVAIALAPQITVTPLNAAPGNINLTVTCTPRLLPEQEHQVSLIFGSRGVLPASVTQGGPTDPTTLDFTITNVPAGSYLVRLRVEGIDSLPITITGSPAVFDFDPQQIVTVA